jgi:hypothetical protein
MPKYCYVSGQCVHLLRDSAVATLNPTDFHYQPRWIGELECVCIEIEKYSINAMLVPSYRHPRPLTTELRINKTTDVVPKCEDPTLSSRLRSRHLTELSYCLQRNQCHKLAGLFASSV